MPKYLDFRRQLTYTEAQVYCSRSGGSIPSAEIPQYATCANTIKARMQLLFKLQEVPKTWTSQGSNSDGERHVLCIAGKLRCNLNSLLVLGVCISSFLLNANLSRRFIGTA